jgi:hypothetical protein
MDRSGRKGAEVAEDYHYNGNCTVNDNGKHRQTQRQQPLTNHRGHGVHRELLVWILCVFCRECSCFNPRGVPGSWLHVTNRALA